MPPPVQRHPQSFNSLRKQLDEMGYFQPLVMDALPLVEALVHDLVSVTNDARAKHTRDFRTAEEPKSHKTPKAKSKSLTETKLREKASDLERQVVDLQLLNAQSVSVVKKLQGESHEKSRKIAKMEEALSKGARVIVRQPKIEMTSLRKPRQRRPSPPPDAPRVEFDLVAMYENRTLQLSDELGRMQKKLDEAHENLAKVERALDERERTLDPLPPAASEEPQSAYMLHLIHENERLKKRMGGADVHGRRVQIVDPPASSPARQLKSNPRSRSRHHSPHAHHHQHQVQHSQYHSCEDIRSAVELSHLQMHNKCLKNQVEHLAREGSRSTDCLLEEYDLVHAELKKALGENASLKRRMQDLNCVKNRLKSEVEELKRQHSILIKSGSSDDYGKVKELIGYIEHQRNVYKDSVERLIGRLDPDGSRAEKSLTEAGAKNESHPKGKTTSAQVLKDIQNQSRRILQQSESPKAAPSGSTGDETTELEENSYHPSEYRNTSAARVSQLLETSSGIAASELNKEAEAQGERVDRILTLERDIEKVKGALADLRREKAEAETRLRAEADALEAENARLRETTSALRERLAAAERSESAKEKYPSSLTELKRQLEEKAAQVCGLEATLADKHLHLQRMSDDKDRMQSMLDGKTLELVEVKRRGADAESAAARAEADMTVAEQRLQQCMDEMSRLNVGLHDEEQRTRAMRERMSAEKAVGVDLRRDNERLKEQLRGRTEEQTRLEGQIAELNENMRRYVTEVKRIEEVLAIKEKERSEILQQYKTLSLEIETSESYGRKMAAKAESVEVQLAARTAELDASHRRLADLEKDLVEMTVSNETYRAQLAALGSKVDLAQSQLKEAKSQATWVNSDMSSIHELAVQLGSQKAELREQIATQNTEIENLQTEIRSLRQEVENVTMQCVAEREKAEVLQEQVSKDSRKHGSDER